MKKKVAVLLSLVMRLSMLICGCGGSNASQITFSSGETLTAKEVKKLDNTNGYINDDVTIEMTVKKVSDNDIYSSDSMWIQCFWYSQGFDTSTVSDDLADTLASLNGGDRIRVTGELHTIGVSVTVINVSDVEVIQ